MKYDPRVFLISQVPDTVVCSVCRSLVPRGHYDGHLQWHERQDKEIRSARRGRGKQRDWAETDRVGS